ncbi:MAG: hypothetical protein HKL85_09175 [Acidimicrobiaceae bacterium]|nr:hypothetical protein [Acidimicrobiaceae bacterium]
MTNASVTAKAITTPATTMRRVLTLVEAMKSDPPALPRQYRLAGQLDQGCREP